MLDGVKNMNSKNNLCQWERYGRNVLCVALRSCKAAANVKVIVKPRRGLRVIDEVDIKLSHSSQCRLDHFRINLLMGVKPMNKQYLS